MGIDPVELQFHPVDFFRRAGEDDDIAQLRYEKNEGVRQVRHTGVVRVGKMRLGEQEERRSDCKRAGTRRLSCCSMTRTRVQDWSPGALLGVQGSGWECGQRGQKGT